MPFDRDRLKSRRVDMGLTLQEVADTIGVEKPTVQRYESGKINKIDTITVEKLASTIKCSPAYLMGWQSTPQVEQESNYNLSDYETNCIIKFRSLDEMGKHTVDTVLNVEYNRVQKDTKNIRLNNQTDDEEVTLTVAARGGGVTTVKTTKKALEGLASLEPENDLDL